MSACASWPVWSHDKGLGGESYRTILPDGTFVYLHCARLVTNPRLPKYDRNRYRFEWRAKVSDPIAEAQGRFSTHDHGRTIAKGPTSAVVKADVAALVAEAERCDR